MAHAIALPLKPFNPLVLLVLVALALVPRCVAHGEGVSLAASAGAAATPSGAPPFNRRLDMTADAALFPAFSLAE